MMNLSQPENAKHIPYVAYSIVKGLAVIAMEDLFPSTPPQLEGVQEASLQLYSGEVNGE